ncbi:hemerythrin domain-containing protein [Rugamonas sp. FT82W]|uniref:Hemerythrin domain-containing protein n=1 Tax=Duganella vulcania TaxID=2692166 RepID=A0A845FYT6_9BURK|nr:hemerythrin domain-containing protein [Duganella vulcania]MYM85748.1 hemerythrin domain-containing protein [Duganella vulcania]
MDTEKFKRDHGDIMAHVTQLKKFTQAGIVENADAIAKQIVAMSSVIKLHLAAEDRVLYPALAKSADPDIARVGKEFQQNMGDIAAAYMKFASSWNTGKKVSEDPDGFRIEANSTLKALHQRIQMENNELYPLADKI